MRPNQKVDWEALYIEINTALPNDPRFQLERFYRFTPITEIMKTVSVLREREYQRLHNESVPLSLLTCATIRANAKHPDRVKATDYQPYRHLVEEDKTPKPRYTSNHLDRIQLAFKYGLVPGWCNSVFAEDIKGRDVKRVFTPMVFSAPNFVGFGPYLKKNVIGFDIVATGPDRIREKLTLYFQRKVKDRDKELYKWGTIEIPAEFRKPDLIIQKAEFPILESTQPRYWRL